MNIRITYVFAIAAAFATLLPALAMAQTTGPLLSNGLFGCNQNGAYSMSVGSMTAVGGTYVPVADAAVELNTGYLVYEECVLRNVVDRQREVVTSALANNQLTTIATGRNGSAYFVQNYPLEYTQVGNSAAQSALPVIVSGATPVYQSDIQTGLARSYSLSVNAPQLALTCPYTVTASTWTAQNTDFWGALAAAENPTCIEMSEYALAQNQLYNSVAAAQYAWQTQLGWGNGYYPITNAAGIVTTPGYAVANIANQAINTGFQQAQAANDLGQMVGSLFASLSSQVLSAAAGGLTGLLTSVNGQPSYLSAVQAESNNSLDQTITSVAAQQLVSSVQTETQYNQAVNTIATALSNAALELRSAENQCWNNVIAQVCSATSTSATGGSTCETSSGASLTIATSSAMSQSIIDQQITPLASSTAQDLSVSNQALQTLQTLLSEVEANSSPAVQQSAVQQLDTLISDNALHTQADVQNVTSQAQSVQQTYSTIVQNTVTTWTTGTPDTSNPYDPNSGWCNTADPDVIAMWQAEWRTQ